MEEYPEDNQKAFIKGSPFLLQINTLYHSEYIILTTTHGGGSIMLPHL